MRESETVELIDNIEKIEKSWKKLKKVEKNWKNWKKIEKIEKVKDVMMNGLNTQLGLVLSFCDFQLLLEIPLQRFFFGCYPLPLF